MHHDAIAAMGTGLGPSVLANCAALYDAEQVRLAATQPALVEDLAYGPAERHRLDLYGTATRVRRPVLLFVHGGGFVQGDKGGVRGDAANWANANVGRMAAARGMLGAVMNYRLAPDNPWPAGAQDVATALQWLRVHAGEHGGDGDRIVLIGTSAGAVHISGFLMREPKAGQMIRGAVLLSGLYGYTPLDQRDELYYGGSEFYPQRMPREVVVTTEVPLLIATAEFDPPRFQAEFCGLLGERLERRGAMPRSYIASGHNH